MPETKSRLADDLSRLFNDAAGIAGGVRREVETLVKSQLDRLLSTMDVVTREEFEAVKQMASNARSEADALARRVADLEAKLGKGDAGPVSPTAGAPPL